MEDSLAALVSAVQKRKRGPDEAMLARVEAEVDRKMDNGVRINPVFREKARRAEGEEDEARRARSRSRRRRCLGAKRGTAW